MSRIRRCAVVVLILAGAILFPVWGATEEQGGAPPRYRVKFYRGDYPERQQKAREDGAVCYVEEHFNATDDPATNYTMVLITDTASAFTRSWAQFYSDTLSARLKLPKGYDNGIKVLKDGDRGYGNLRHSPMPAILLEPFFLSNATGLEWASSKQDILAGTLVESIRTFFPRGGLIAFSVGHRYKVSRPDDRGAGPYGGAYEIEFNEPVMEKAARLLDPMASLPSDENRAHYEPLFDELCRQVEENFYNPGLIARDFSRIKSAWRKKAINSSYDREFASTVNGMLGELHTSHTLLYTRDDAAYYQLASIFSHTDEIKKLFNGREITCPATGMLTREIEGKTFIQSVLAGGAAERAGLLRGDEIVSADDRSFLSMAGFNPPKEGARLMIRRTGKGDPFAVRLTAPQMNPSAEFLEAQRQSARVFTRGGKKIGYIHVWSFAGGEYYEDLCSTVTHGALKEADGLVLDLRDGWGGADPAYLNLFNRNVPTVTMIDRRGVCAGCDSQYRKPVVMLINGGTRSGKEILAFGFRAYKLGALIGEKTAGATMAGKPIVLSDGSILYLAVMATKINGEDLEGKGVAPDTAVPWDVRYCEGRDGQLEKALEWMTGKLHEERPRGGAGARGEL